MLCPTVRDTVRHYLTATQEALNERAIAVTVAEIASQGMGP